LGQGCTLILTDTGFGTAAPGGRRSQTPRGFEGWGDSAVYYMEDSSPDGRCFDPQDGPWPLQSLVPAVEGIQDGIHTHTFTRTLLYCDGTGAWIWSMATKRPLGIVMRPCTQLALEDSDGLSAVYILAETELYATTLNFGGSGAPGIRGKQGISEDPSNASDSKSTAKPRSGRGETGKRRRLRH